MSEQKDWHVLEFNTPISENAFVNDEFIIKGTAISETTTHNNHKYIAEELEKAAPSMQGRPLLVDHDNRIESIKGKVVNSYFDASKRQIMFEAKVMDKNIREMIRDGRISNVSIGAYAEDLVKDDVSEAYIAKGIKIAELSLVAVPADENASFAMAMANNIAVKESMSPTVVSSMVTSNINEGSNTQTHTYTNERRYDKMEVEKALVEKSEMDAVIAEKATLVAELNQLKAEKRANKVSEYKKLCTEKKIAEKDVSKMSEETIDVLIETVKDIQVNLPMVEKKELKSVVNEYSDIADNFMIERSSDGLSIFMMPDSKSRMPKFR